MKSNKKVLLILGVLIAVVIVYYLLSGYSTEPKNLDDFAKCLTNKGAVMYGAVWCPHCKDQKTMLGQSFKYVNYVECPDNQALCDQNGIIGYPTWIINETQYQGVQSLETLSNKTDCPLS